MQGEGSYLQRSHRIIGVDHFNSKYLDSPITTSGFFPGGQFMHLDIKFTQDSYNSNKIQIFFPLTLYKVLKNTDFFLWNSDLDWSMFVSRKQSAVCFEYYRYSGHCSSYMNDFHTLVCVVLYVRCFLFYNNIPYGQYMIMTPLEINVSYSLTISHTFSY